MIGSFIKLTFAIVAAAYAVEYMDMLDWHDPRPLRTETEPTVQQDVQQPSKAQTFTERVSQKHHDVPNANQHNTTASYTPSRPVQYIQ